MLVTDRKYSRGDLSGVDCDPGDRAHTKLMAASQCSLYLPKAYLLFFLIFVTPNRTAEERIDLHWLTVLAGFQPVTMGKVEQTMWLVAGRHGRFLTPGLRQEAENTAWNQEWVDPP